MDFLENNPLYVVGIISGIIWIGLFVFLLGLDRRLRKVESGQFGDE